MAAETETSEGVVFKSEDDAILLKDAKGEPWRHYLKYGRNYDSYKPEVGQKVRVHYRAWENPTTSKVSYYLNEVEVLGPPPEDGAAPPSFVRAPSPAGPGPAVAYQATHDAAQARVNRPEDYDPKGGVLMEMDASLPGQERVAQQEAGIPLPDPGSHAFRDLSIMRQNRLNVSVQALVANLEQCSPEEKAGRMITPWMIAAFEQLLIEGAAHEAENMGEPPPEDLPGGP